MKLVSRDETGRFYNNRVNRKEKLADIPEDCIAEVAPSSDLSCKDLLAQIRFCDKFQWVITL